MDIGLFKTPFFRAFLYLSLSLLTNIAAAMELTGQWEAALTPTSTNPGNAGCTEQRSSQTIAIDQQGDSLGIQFTQGLATGTLTGDQFSASLSYPHRGGTMTAHYSGTAESCDYGHGIYSWSWRLSSYRCSGEGTITFRRIGECPMSEDPNEEPAAPALELDPAVFDIDAYTALNPDVAAAFGGQRDAIAGHWLDHGIHEGRSASYAFELREYKRANADLASQPWENSDFIAHWLSNGRKEGRTASRAFAPRYYLTNNPDLQALYQRTDNYEAVIQHWINTGIGECRNATPGFRPSLYVAERGDLGDDRGVACRTAVSHYLTNPSIAANQPSDSATGSGELIGRVESFTSYNYRFRGWVYDPADITRTVQVRLYLDGELVSVNNADYDLPDLPTNASQHGFIISLPSTRTTTGPHELALYAISSRGDASLTQLLQRSFVVGSRAGWGHLPIQWTYSNSLGMTFVELPAGEFNMGSDDPSDLYATPRHTVHVEGFRLMMNEVTQAQWRSIMGENPSRHDGCGGDCPVENVTWNQIQTFIEQLNHRTGDHYRLPTEAEWEYALRASTRSDNAYWFGSSERFSDFGNCAGEGDDYLYVAPVSSFPPNPWGLYDMTGNIAELVQDPWHDTYQGAPTDGGAFIGGAEPGYRVARGGSWADDGTTFSRSATRRPVAETDLGLGGRYGFRLVQEQ